MQNKDCINTYNKHMNTNTNENKIKYPASCFVSNDITGALVFR